MPEKRIREIKDLPQEWEEAWAAGLLDWDDIEWATYNDVDLDELILFHALRKREKWRLATVVVILIVVVCGLFHYISL